MMKAKEIAERLLTRLARLSASSLSLTGLRATEEPINIGRAAKRAVLFLSFSFCE